MRRFAFVVTIQNSFFHNLNEFREFCRHQLFCRVEKNDVFNKLLLLSKQLIIKNFIKK